MYTLLEISYTLQNCPGEIEALDNENIVHTEPTMILYMSNIENVWWLQKPYIVEGIEY